MQARPGQLIEINPWLRVAALKLFPRMPIT